MAADVQVSPTRAPASRSGRFIGFAVVGASGLVVNQVALWFLTSKVGIYYLLSAVIATQISTIWNFALVERFVFDGGHEGRWVRLGWFALMNNLWLLFRTPFLYLLTTGAGLNYLISNAVVLGAMTLVRFGIADNLIWADRADLRGASALVDGKRIWNYDIQGIIGISSESRLPELVRFQVPALQDPADIEVVVSNEGFGGLRRTIDVVEEGSTISYVEHLGRHGFAAKIDVDTLARIQVSQDAASFAARRLHERGGARRAVGHGPQGVHPRARGVPADRWARRADHGAHRHREDHDVPEVDQGAGHGVRLRRHGHHRSRGQRAVVPEAADDLVAHANAVKGAPLPLRTRSWLQVQGRLHSKFGRSVGMAFGNINLPVASMSAIVQMIIPPPKFQVDRLIPEAEMVSSLTLDRLVVIERGDAILRELGTEEAFDILSENTEDAYGFPPYPRIGHALSNGEASVEQDIRRRLVAGLEAVLLRTPDRAWFEMLPRLAAGIGTESGTTVVDVTNEDQVMLDLTGAGAPQDRTDATVIAIGADHTEDPVASRFEKLSPTEAEEVENALSGALALLQKVSDILDGQNEHDEPAVSGLVASVRSLRDARVPQGKR